MLFGRVRKQPQETVAVMIRSIAVRGGHSCRESITDTGQIRKILADGWLSAEEKQAALSRLHIRLSNRIVAQVVRRIKSDIDSVFVFVRWAASTYSLAVSTRTYARVIIGLAMAGKFEPMWDLVEEMGRNGHVIPVPLFSTVIKCYGRAGDVEGAMATLNKMGGRFSSKPDAKAYQALIVVLLDAGEPSRAVSVYYDMVDNAGLRPSLNICKAMLRGLAASTESAIEFLADLQKMGWDAMLLYNALIRGYVDAGKIDAAHKAFLGLRSKANAVTYNLVALGCCKAGDLDRCVELYHELTSRGYAVNFTLFNSLVCELSKAGRTGEACNMLTSRHGCADVITFSMLIHALCTRGQCDQALELLQVMSKQGVTPNVVTYTSLVDGLCKVGRLNFAFHLFRTMPCSPNTYTYNCLIHALCRKGKLEDAFTLLKSMQASGCIPSINNKNTLMDGICKYIIMQRESRAFGEYGQRVFAEDIAVSCSAEESSLGLLYSYIEYMFGNHAHLPDQCTYSIIIHFLCKANKVIDAARVWRAMVKRLGRADIDVVAYNCFLYGLVRLNNLDEAATLFDEIDKPTLVSHSLLVHACFKAGDLGRVSEVYQALAAQGMQPDIVLYNITLDGLSKVNMDTEVTQLCAEMLNNGIRPSVFTYSILIHGLCCSSRLQTAKEIFDQMKERGCHPNVVTYNTILHCLCKNYLLDEAIGLFREMKEHCSYTPASWNIIIDGILEKRDLRAAEGIFLKLLEDGFFPAYITYDTLVDRILQVQNRVPSNHASRLHDMQSFGYSRIVEFFLD